MEYLVPWACGMQLGASEWVFTQYSMSINLLWSIHFQEYAFTYTWLEIGLLLYHLWQYYELYHSISKFAKRDISYRNTVMSEYQPHACIVAWLFGFTNENCMWNYYAHKPLVLACVYFYLSRKSYGYITCVSLDNLSTVSELASCFTTVPWHLHIPRTWLSNCM